MWFLNPPPPADGTEHSNEPPQKNFVKTAFNLYFPRKKQIILHVFCHRRRTGTAFWQKSQNFCITPSRLVEKSLSHFSLTRSARNTRIVLKHLPTPMPKQPTSSTQFFLKKCLCRCGTQSITAAPLKKNHAKKSDRHDKNFPSFASSFCAKREKYNSMTIITAKNRRPFQMLKIIYFLFLIFLRRRLNNDVASFVNKQIIA